MGISATITPHRILHREQIEGVLCAVGVRVLFLFYFVLGDVFVCVQGIVATFKTKLRLIRAVMYQRLACSRITIIHEANSAQKRGRRDFLLSGLVRGSAAGATGNVGCLRTRVTRQGARTQIVTGDARPIVDCTKSNHSPSVLRPHAPTTNSRS